MANVLIVIYLLIVLAMIGVILMQRSEGGALGIGGGGNGNFQVRSQGDLLSRTTAILAALFFATAIGLTVINEIDRTTSTILDSAAQGEEGEAPTSVLDALNNLQGATAPEETPAAPAEDAPDLAVPQSGDTPTN